MATSAGMLSPEALANAVETYAGWLARQRAEGKDRGLVTWIDSGWRPNADMRQCCPVCGGATWSTRRLGTSGHYLDVDDYHRCDGCGRGLHTVWSD